MAIQEAALATTSLSEGLGPNRLHHAAWVTLDSEATRHFYEDVLGVPLVATWCEEMNGQSYVHTFYAMRDGGALAFFEYADQARRDNLELKSPTRPKPISSSASRRTASSTALLITATAARSM
jgi:catechol 2,3-dioxygenase-like lactoylglutathione lyase family enzyme